MGSARPEAPASFLRHLAELSPMLRTSLEHDRSSLVPFWARWECHLVPYFSGKVEVMQFPELVEARADVMMGKPCLKGTRIPVYLILEKLAADETRETIFAAYPQLKPEHIKASLEYAARLAADEIVLANQ